jgi:hypothetical protein
VVDEPPTEVITEFGLGVGAGGGDDKLEDEEDRVGGCSEVNTVELDVGGGSGGAVGILVELVLATVRLGPGAEFIAS